LGLKPHEFWECTFEELELMFEGYHKRREQELYDLLTAAWYSVALDRQKKLPKLESLLKKGKTPKIQQPKTLTYEEKIKLLENKGLALPKG
jgi:aspartyl/asparaginyl-tRNA synthetase